MMKVFDFVKVNLKCMIKLGFKIAGSMFAVLTLILAFITWEELGVSSAGQRVLVLLAVPIISIVFVTILLFAKTSNIIWEQGVSKIKLMYGDILKFAFPSKNKDDRIVVIPVNTCFGTIVGDGLVSPKTIHGKWIKSMNERGVSTREINTLIEHSIIIQGNKAVGRFSDIESQKGSKYILVREQ